MTPPPSQSVDSLVILLLFQICLKKTSLLIKYDVTSVLLNGVFQFVSYRMLNVHQSTEGLQIK